MKDKRPQKKNSGKRIRQSDRKKYRDTQEQKERQRDGWRKLQ